MKSPQLPSPALAKDLGIENEVWLKYENKHHYGSHKGRSIPIMVSEYNKTGVNNFCISSSGNAALAAIRAILSHNKNKPQNQIELQIFVGNKINADKLANLKNEIGTSQKIILQQVENPKQSAFLLEKEKGVKYLRASTDPLALVGYQSLAAELSKIENLEAVFIPTSSGTTAQGLYESFKLLNINTQIHIVQTNSCCPIVAHLYSQKNQPAPKTCESPSIAGAIVDLVGHRKEAVTEAVINSGGNGWVVSDEEIENAIQLAKNAGAEISPNSALSIAGLKQAIDAGYRWKGPVVCLITGN